MNQFIRPVQITPEAHLIQSFWKHPGAPVGIHMNSMVLASREPVVFDTGVAADRDGWLAAVSSVVEPDDVRWIVVTHEDPDHTGNLATAVEQLRNATVVTSWWMTERLVGTIDLDPRRMRWVASGESLDIGDRTLTFHRPPIFDSPTTRAVFDTSTGLFWAGDLGAALGPEAVVHADEMPADELAASFVAGHGWISPWISMVDDTKYQTEVNRIANLGITTWAQTHGPVYEGAHIDRAIELLRGVPAADAVPQPGQADLDAVVASMLTAA
ncbi:MBL fold metallo-hydrolase [Ilumatobacter sp.]|uniref:MBL fold metallo-hydrolase n=1 Tax=Ilumatobacter sp. TaxID=1967498 RepID=UPI003C44F062